MSLDITLLRNLVTVAAFVAFLGIVWWAYSPARRGKLEQQGRSILDEQVP
jgi:cytochrome c oxidase cbb3-type subunit 4